MKVKDKDIWRYSINSTEKILFDKALENKRFNHLWQYVIDENNIICSIKIIGSNSGKKTAGPDGITFNDLMKMDFNIILKEIKRRLYGKTKGKAREVLIPKSNGKMRPLGITNIFDRIAQQCVRNVLEPILEAQFNPESFGFRKNRNAQECMSYIATTMQYNDDGHIYDCDLKNYFDTVQIDKVLDKLKQNHNIHDIAFLRCIKTLMWIDLVNPKKEYNGIGLRQGTILGPILANVMFHDFELKLHEINDFKRKNGREIIQNPNIHKNHGKNYKRGKEFYFNWLKQRRVVKIIRYADDFVLISKGKYDIYDAIILFEDWCKENGLEINTDKTKLITIHGDTQIEFLGYRYRKTNSTKKHSFIISVKDQKKLWRVTKSKLEWSLRNNKLDYFIVYIRGIFNYYNICTNLAWLISRIQLLLIKLKHRRRNKFKIKIVKTPYYSFEINGKLLDLWTMRIHSVKSTMNYMYEVHELWSPHNEKFKASEWVKHFFENRTKTGKNSGNIIYVPSLLNQQKKDPILEVELLSMPPQEVHIHHKKPLSIGGTDEYNNLMLISRTSHKLIHSTNISLDDVPRYINIKQLNKYRKLCNLKPII